MTRDDVLDDVEAALVTHFGHTPQRASMSFVGVEPIEILRFEPIPGERAYASLGMSRHPMVGADELVRSAQGPRAELVLYVRDPTDVHAQLWRRLAVLAAAPAVEGVVYQPGMSVDLGEPFSEGSHCTGALVLESAIADIPAASGPVAMLEVRPATRAELAWCRVRGAPALLERWSLAGVDTMDLERSAVPLD